MKFTKQDGITEPVPAETERVAKEIVDSAFRIHSHLDPGLIESVYERCTEHERAKRRMRVRRQVRMPIVYDGTSLEGALKLDLIVELKAVDSILPVHRAQLLSYLKLSAHRLGFLIHSCVPLIREGIKRVVL